MLHLHYIDCACRGTGEWTAPDGLTTMPCDSTRYLAVEANEWWRHGRPATADEYLASKAISEQDARDGLGDAEPQPNTGFELQLREEMT